MNKTTFEISETHTSSVTVYGVLAGQSMCKILQWKVPG